MEPYLHVLPTNWGRTGQIIGLTVLGYLLMLLLLRMAGKHVFTQTSPFTMILIVSIGAIFAGSITQGKLTFVDGFAMLTVLIILISLTSWIVSRNPRLRTFLNSKPTLLYYDGQFISENLRRENVTEEDIKVEMRQTGQIDPRNVHAVILESNGTYSVIPAAVVREHRNSLLLPK